MKSTLFLLGFSLLFLSNLNAQTATAPSNGDGSAGSPYEIATIEHLYWLSQNSGEWGNHYIQTADIDASASSGWDGGAGFTPIGNSSTNFTGEYNGQGHTITGLYINRPATDFQGFFGFTFSAAIKNVGLLDVNITGEDNVGGLVGQNGDYNAATSIDGSFTTGTVTGDDTIGGLIGKNDEGTVSSSYSTCTVSGDEIIGGLVGESFGGNTIETSFATGDVTGDETVGGLVGYNENTTVENSYSTGDVTGRESSTGYFVGGLIGENDLYSTIINSFSTGRISDASFTGGFIGNNSSSATVTNCYWNTETSGRTTGANEDTNGMTGLTTAQMKQQSSFSGWDFSTVWAFTENSFPHLQQTDHRIIDFSISGTAGWRTMTLAVQNKYYSSLLDSLWTQGFTGADDTGGSSNVRTWDENSGQFVSISDAGDIPSRGTGFIMYVYSDDDNDGSAEGFPKSLLVEGDETTGSVSPTLSYTDTGTPEDDGWNLVGNPYPVTIDWDASSGWTKTNLDNVIYIWDNSIDDYRTWNGVEGTLSDGKIAPWQGFWIQANAASPDLTMTEDVQSSGGTFYKQNQVPDISFELADNDGRASKAIVMFHQNAREGKDRLDAWQLQPLSADYLSLFTRLADGGPLDIQALPLNGDNEKSNKFNIGLDFEGSDLDGSYQLSWETEDLPAGWSYSLLDTKTGARTDINKQSSYKFDVAGAKSKLTQPDESDETPAKPFPKVLKEKSPGARFIIEISTGSEQHLADEIPTTMELNQNYPNPFNPATVIQYGVPEESQVQLAVYNILGRKVATLVTGIKSAGRHEVNFNGAKLSSGLYVYRLQVGPNVITKKMMLIK